jgi:hypothetical protein
MHLEVLVEDASGKLVLEPLLEKILGPWGAPNTYRLHSYKGLGKIPKGLKSSLDPSKRVLLASLPKLLRGFGRTYEGIPAAVVVVVDLDDRDCMSFKRELLTVLESCQPRPQALFRIAIEEIEAWLLGDRRAIQQAYPKARTKVLDTYRQDSICGTWETLAEAIYPGGAAPLKKAGYPLVGQVKCDWARKIAPHLRPDENRSPSFQVFRQGLERLIRSNPS